MTVSSHIDPADLRLFLNGILAAGERERIEQHLRDCSRCRQLLDQLQRPLGDTAVARNEGPVVTATDTPSGDQLHFEVASFSGSSASPEPSARAAEPAGLYSFLAPASNPEELGWLASYRVVRLIGSGGMGMVFEAEDASLQRRVALKVMQPELAADPKSRDRFLQEARAAASVVNDHIVTIFQVGQHNNVPFLAMQYLEGESLEQRLRREARLPLLDVLRIGSEVAEGLSAAHTRGLIHRDIKPANIWLESAGPDPLFKRVRILDFGLARSRTTDRHLTSTGMIVGTPGYMAPEQARAGALDHRCDLFSLGCVLYRMLTGQEPFPGGDVLAVLCALAMDDPRPIEEFDAAVPPALTALVSELLAKSPENRPGHAREVRDRLREAAGEQRLGVSATGTGERESPREARQAPSSASHRAPERRQVTVVACGCDLFESEQFLGDLDAEDQSDLLRAFRHACEQATLRFGGTIVAGDEQGLVACFGYPVALEDSARRAALAGLAIIDAATTLHQKTRTGQQLELKPQVGIHTGPAIVETAGAAISLVGEPRNVALQLRKAAEPTQVVCADPTQRMLHNDLDYVSLGSRKLKGVSQPIALFRVLTPAPLRNPIEAAASSGLTPLTARDHEVSLLRDRWEQAEESRGQVVLLIGEPGVGKSRLVYTIKQHVRGPGATVSSQASVIRKAAGPANERIVEWRCSPHYQNTSLNPARDFWERLLSFSRDEAPALRFERLVRNLDEIGLARPDVVPLFASLLSLPTDARFPSIRLPPARERQETFRVMREWLCAWSRQRPLLFIVEDLHWADPSTLEFLGQFLVEAVHEHVLSLLTFRPEFQSLWRPVAHQTSLSLNRLSRRQVGELMRQQMGTLVVPEALIEQIYDRTGGVPLFVEEFTKMVQESNLLAQAGGSPNWVLPEHAVPATLQDLVMARLDRLGAERELAQLAATLGREFSYDLLAAVSMLDDPALAAELAKLVEAEVLFAKGTPPRCNFAFKHALLQDAAYNSLVKATRHQGHERIAAVLEARFPQMVELQPELLAHHCTEAGLVDKAVGYWLKAGLRARERYADVEAIGQLKRGLTLLEGCPESAERDALELQFLNPLGTAYIAARGYAASEVGPVFRRARQLCERIGEPNQLFAIMWGIFAWHVVRGEFRLCTDLAAEAMDFATRRDDAGLRMQALFLQGLTLFYRGDFAGARDHCGRALATYEDPERALFWAARTGENVRVTHRCYLALAWWHLGYSDQALKINREAIELARALGQPFSLEYALHHSAWLHQHCRLGAEVQAAGGEELQIATEQGFRFWHASATLYQAAGLLLQGWLDEGLPLFQQGIDAYRASGAALALPYYLSTLATAQIQAGRFAAARQAIDEGLKLVEQNDDRFQEAELHRLKGALLLAESADQAAAAEVCFRTAIDTARRQRSRAWELRATMSLAQLWDRQGRRDEARTGLAAVTGTYTEGFTTPDLVEATTLLRELAEPTPRTARDTMVRQPPSTREMSPQADAPSTAAPEPAPAAPRSPPEPPRDRRRMLLLVGGMGLVIAIGLSAFWFGRSPRTGSLRPEPIKVGVLHSLSGTMRGSEEAVQQATLLAIEEINQRGGVLGRPILPVVADGQSNEATFAREAERLIQHEKVSAIFGCWTSASRKAVKPIVEKHDHLLVYPVQYEGLEQSTNIVYLGSAPNQQILPAVAFAIKDLGKRRLFLVGSDYVFPRAAHAIIRDQVKKESGVEIVGEVYIPLGSGRVGTAIDLIVKTKPDVILNSINGSSNTSFFNGLRNAGITSDKVPTISFSIGENQLLGFTIEDVVGDYAASSYFMSIDRPENRTFINRFQTRYGPQRVISDPMESGYVGVHLWAEAVASAQSTDPPAVRAALRGREISSPHGTMKIDPETLHAWKPFRVGKILPTGQFDIVFTRESPIRPQPYPDSRTPAQWQRFLDDLYQGWGKRWEGPRR